MGELSTVNATLTQQQIDDAVSAIVTNVPSLTHIAIGTYLDYPTQIVMWAQSIHAAGKKLALRSLGFNDWRGTNGVSQYTSSDFDAHSTTQYVAFVNSNYTIFQAGDIFEPIPDQPEDNSRWVAQYTTIASGTGKTAFNTFITDAISQINTALAGHSVTGVVTNVAYLTPTVAQNTITSATASALRSVGTNDFPESGLTAVIDQATALQSEITTYINPAQSASTPWHITFGPNKFDQLDQQTQADTLVAEFRTILGALTHPLDGITISPFGEYSNSPTGRLFDWEEVSWTDILYEGNGMTWIENLFNFGASQWVAHSGVASLQEMFTGVTPSTIGVLTILETAGTKSTTAVLTTLETAPKNSTTALLTTLSAPAQSTTAILTTLETATGSGGGVTSRTAILTTLESAPTNSTTALLITLEATQKSTVGISALLENDSQFSTTALSATLETTKRSNTALVTTLESAVVKSTIALTTVLEAPSSSTTALLTVLESPQTTQTVAVLTTFETAPVVSTVAVLTTLESATRFSTTAIQTTLENPSRSTIALLSTLENPGYATIALSTTLEQITTSTTGVLTTLETSIQKKTVALTANLERNNISTVGVLTLMESHPTASTVAIRTDLQVVVKSTITIGRFKRGVTVIPNR
jgi:hypothetical protein